MWEMYKMGPEEWQTDSSKVQLQFTEYAAERRCRIVHSLRFYCQGMWYLSVISLNSVLLWSVSDYKYLFVQQGKNKVIKNYSVVN